MNDKTDKTSKSPMDEMNEYLEDRSRALIKKNTADNTELVAVVADDGFAAAAADADRNLLKGELLKFVDGVWTLGGQPVPGDAKFIPEKIFACWVRWEDRRPVEYVWPRPNGMLPHRDDLSHNDPNDWPAGIDGTSSAPWRSAR